MTLETLLLLAWLKACAITYNLPPEFVKAVADVEGSGFHTGPLNMSKTLWGPMGINIKCCVPGTRNPYINIIIGVQALIKHGATSNPLTWKKALRKYNTKFTMSYYNSIMRRYRVYKKEGLR